MFKKKFLKSYELYFFLLPALIYLIIFVYWPMYGLQIAFKNFKPGLSMLDSPFVGLDHFKRFFSSYLFWTLIKNTVTISFYQIFASFPLSITLAVCLNYAYSKRFKRFVQTVSYAPHFISQVVLVGMILIFLSPRSGIVNIIIKGLGFEAINFMAIPEMFKSIYVWSGVWQNIGFSSILYLAVLTGSNPEIHEAAIVDGASKFKRVWYIDIPVLLPTCVIVLVMNIGRVMSIGFEKIYLMQNTVNIMSSEILATYIYKLGIMGGQFSYTAAIGLFNNLINLILLITCNIIAKKITKHGLY